MAWEMLDHTADVGVEIRNPTREGVYEEALRAFTNVLTPLAGVAEAEERSFTVAAPGLDELMVAWLEELLFAFEVEELLFARAEVGIEEGQIEGGLDGFTLTAAARGERYDPDRHPLKVLIKGVTFHHLEVRPEGSGWFARVIFDI